MNTLKAEKRNYDNKKPKKLRREGICKPVICSVSEDDRIHSIADGQTCC